MSASENYLDQPRAGRLNIQYAPVDGVVMAENPPRFMWLPVVEEEATYVLRVARDDSYTDAHVFSDLPLNFLTPDVVFEPGEYVWSYAVWDAKAKGPATEWSKNRSFSIAEGATEVPLAGRGARYAKSDMAHPRLWLGPKELAAFKKDLAKDADHCAWSTFFEKSAAPWMDRPVMDEPVGYENHQRTPPVWRQTYIDCQELMYAIRHLAVAGQVLEDSAMLDRAKEWLLAAADWDPAGTTSRAYTDEWAFRVTLALGWGYDWLYNELSDEERTKVRTALLIRTREIAEHIIDHANIHLFPYDSHAVRAVSAVLVPCCIAMLDEEPEAREWLDYSIEFLSTVYTPWGDDQGGWAEGPHYWMTGQAYLIDAANLLKAFTGFDLYERPFFQKTGDMPLYTKAPDTRRATFGDDSTMGDLPCLKIGYNLRQYAGVTGNGAYQWYYDEIKRNDPGTEMAFYNWGWWDFNFDEMLYRQQWPIVEAKAPAADDRLRWFKGIGWVAIQSKMDVPEEHLQFVFKASSFGSISHSHGDQNAFCLAAYGEDLAIQSGHYVAFNSSMHQKWRRQTISKNAILINGKGQYADRDKAKQMQSTGQVLAAEERDDHIYIKGDATAAYQSLSPEVTRVHREIYFVNNSYFVIVDTIDADEPVTIDFRIHANGPFQLGKGSFRYTGDKAGFYGEVLWSEAGKPEISQETGFPGVDMKEVEGLPISTCMTASYPKAKRHRIATLLVPYSTTDPKRIFHFLDDQGYDCDLYFTDADENSFKVVVEKLAKA
ncbi:DUF4962 domain-containing protein [Pelagimonas varians]|uniref:Heparin-sulfate lyase n=1 Tax=Pelagimonas varians TaxID=696760 RepID=A0A238L4M6_9RHOB|nr:DUF4962 domain-containing protein [Pelagimonas varians]PYG26409.1 heparinase II/III-like protein [Pelagimonas varians]SMX49979.1 Heparin-sulfate lyase precursor [Pelagimonas varians]